MQILAIKFVEWYRAALSPYWPGSCRYIPTCSHYSQKAIEQYGAGHGVLLAIRRLARCHPFGGHGYDPVP